MSLITISNKLVIALFLLGAQSCSDDSNHSNEIGTACNKLCDTSGITDVCGDSEQDACKEQCQNFARVLPKDCALCLLDESDPISRDCSSDTDSEPQAQDDTVNPPDTTPTTRGVPGCECKEADFASQSGSDACSSVCLLP